MAIFLVLALISFGLMMLLVSVERATQGKRRIFRWRKWIYIAANRWLIEGVAIFGLVAIVAVALFYTFWQIAEPGSNLYNTFDFLTSRVFSQAVLGAIFGVLFAIWILRVYRASASADQHLSIAQKVEGVALLLLFVLGTTSIPLEDFIRGTKINAGVLEVDIGDRLQPNLASQSADPQGAGLQLSSLDPNSNTGAELERLEPGQGMGLQTINSMSSLIKRDIWYMQTYVQADSGNGWYGTRDDLIAALGRDAEAYSILFDTLGECLTGLANVTRDISYVERNLAGIRPWVRELYAQTLAIRSHEAEEFSELHSERTT